MIIITSKDYDQEAIPENLKSIVNEKVAMFIAGCNDKSGIPFVYDPSRDGFMVYLDHTDDLMNNPQIGLDPVNDGIRFIGGWHSNASMIEKVEELASNLLAIYIVMNNSFAMLYFLNTDNVNPTLVNFLKKQV